MKKILLASLICLMAVMAACNKGNGYTVTGKISGLQDGDSVQLIEFKHGNSKPFATAVVTNGEFKFTGTQDEPRAVMLVSQSAPGSVTFILENADINIDGTANRTDNSDGSAYYTYDVKVTGSPLTTELEQKVSYRDELNQLYEANMEKHKEISQQLAAARMAKDQAKLDQLMKSDAYKQLEADEKAFFDTVEAKYQATLDANKDSWWGPFLMMYLKNYFTPQDSADYNKLSETARNSYYGKLVKDEIFPKNRVGEKADPFTVTGDDGDKTLAQLCEGKKYVLIDFWASWCAPCRREIPNLKKLYAQYADNGFQIVSISIDKDKDAWTKACNEEKFPWPTYLDTNGIADVYKVKAIPVMILLDSNGTVLADDLRGEALAAKLAELFK